MLSGAALVPSQEKPNVKGIMEAILTEWHWDEWELRKWRRECSIAAASAKALGAPYCTTCLSPT